VTSSSRRSSRFSFFNLASALWYFLGPERWAFLMFSGILLIVLCYTLVPPYIVGLTTNFLIGHVKSDSNLRPSISPLFWFAGLLSGSYAVVSLIRLSIDLNQRLAMRTAFDDVMRAGMETIGNALEAECYSEASSAAFISLFLISITSLIYRAGDGDR